MTGAGVKHTFTVTKSVALNNNFVVFFSVAYHKVRQLGRIFICTHNKTIIIIKIFPLLIPHWGNSYCRLKRSTKAS
jgi:hypothetical protein